MPACASVLHTSFDGAARLIQQPLQPQGFAEEGACCRPLVVLETNDIRLVDGGT
jgi:hypothetical protein